jgi:hypothetical protein
MPAWAGSSPLIKYPTRRHFNLDTLRRVFHQVFKKKNPFQNYVCLFLGNDRRFDQILEFPLMSLFPLAKGYILKPILFTHFLHLLKLIYFLPGTILIFLGAAHHMQQQEKKAQTIIMTKTGR